MSTSKLFGKDIFITSTTEATSGSIGTLSTLGGINVTKTVLTSGGINSVSNTNTLGNLFTTGGNIGIGTTAPTQALSVEGNFNFTGSLFQNGSVYSGSTQWGSTGANIYFNTGSVGLGTLAPVGRLHMANPSTLNTNNVLFEVGTTTDGGSSGWSALNFNGYYNSGELRINTSKNRWRLAMDQRTTTDRLMFDTYNGTTLTTIMSLNSNGNVGIGNNTATRLLQVGNLNGNTQGTISISNTGEARYHLYNGGTVAEWAMGQRSSTQHNFNITRLVSNVEVDLLTIQTTGNVGIGTTAPSASLHIPTSNTIGQLFVGNAVQNRKIVVYDTNSNDHQFYGLGINSASFRFQIDATSNSYDWYTATSATSSNRLMKLQGNGNLGIGTSAPSRTLDVNGQMRLSAAIPVIDLGNDFLVQIWRTSDSMVFSTNNVIRQFISTSGNIGIGTTSPTTTLDVSGTARITTSLTTGALFSTNQTTTNIVATSSTITNLNIPGTLTVVNITSTNLVETNITAATIIVTGGGLNATFNTNTIGNIYTTAGNVGIGTTSPSARLDVRGWMYLGASVPTNTVTYGNLTLTPLTGTGQCEISFNTASGQRQFIYADNTTGVAIGGNGSVVFQPNNTNRMVITSAGNVNLLSTTSIQTTTNNYSTTSGALNISGDIVLSGTEIMFTNTFGAPTLNGRGSGSKIVLFPQTGVSSGDYSIGIEGNNTWFQVPSSNQGYKFYQGTSANVVISAGGNVGMGITAPAYTLDVVGTVRSSSGMLISGTNMLEFGHGVSGKETNAGKIGYNTFTTGLNIVGAGTNSGFRLVFIYDNLSLPGSVSTGTLRTGAGVSTAAFGSVSAVGNNSIWIGTSTGTLELGIAGTAGGYSTSAIIGDAIIKSAPNKNLMLQTGSSIAHLYIATSGNIGMNNTAPAYRLHVGGDIYATGDVTVFSDKRLKTDIKTIDNALYKVNKLRGVSYKHTETQKESIGLIAQETLDVLPEVVATKGEYLGVNYGNIVGLLVEAIKELQGKIEENKQSRSVLSIKNSSPWIPTSHESIFAGMSTVYQDSNYNYNYNVESGLYTAPTTGYYHMSVYISSNETSDIGIKPFKVVNGKVSYLISGDNTYWIPNNTSNQRCGQYTDVIYLNVGDSIGVSSIDVPFEMSNIHLNIFSLV